MEDDKALPMDVLVNKLRVIEDLRDKLIHVKWSQESLRFLDRVIRDTIVFARQHEIFKTLAERASQLQHQINACLSADKLPRGAERERLIALLHGLMQLSPRAQGPGECVQEPGKGTPAASEILLVSATDMRDLNRRLKSNGFKVRQINSLAEARTSLMRAASVAAIVDADCAEEPLAGIHVVAGLRERIGPLRMPVFFISERTDLAARMEAVAAGGAGYFTKPLNVPVLVDKLNDRLLYESARGYRVLIVNDTAAEGRLMAGALEAKGIITQLLTHPIQVLHAVYRFKPNLLILDLELKETDGIQLAKTIRQHEACDSLPMILLSSQPELSRYLAALGGGGDDLLSKPLATDYLLSAVTYRLRKAQMLFHKLNNLNYRDAVSGLHNRRYFLDLLEQALTAPRDRNSAVGIMLITLDNLRAIERTDISVADEVVERAAGRLRSALDSDQEAARFGAAIFAVLFRIVDREALLMSARAVRAALEDESYTTEGETVRLQTSIGISVASNDMRDPVTLIQHADLACGMARESSEDRIHIYTPSVDGDQELSHRKRLLEAIREAIKQQHMTLLFQPIVNLRGDRTERYEVLLRMHDSEGRELLPETVFAVAQKHQLGMILDRWVVTQAIRLVRERQACEYATRLFINVSPAILQDSEIIYWLKKVFDSAGVHAEDLVFEVAEATAIQQLEQWRQFARGIRALGCGLSLDRFRAHDCAPDLFEKLPATYVKLDARYVHELAKNPDKQKALRKLVEDFSRRNIKTIVGSVEDLPTLEAIWSCGIAYVQGYFLQRPHEKMDYEFVRSAPTEALP